MPHPDGPLESEGVWWGCLIKNGEERLFLTLFADCVRALDGEGAISFCDAAGHRAVARGRRPWRGCPFSECVW